MLFNYSQCFTQFILIHWFFRPQVLSFGLHSQLSLLFLVINAVKATAIFTSANLIHTSLFAFFSPFWQKHFISSLASKLNQNFLAVFLITTCCILSKKPPGMNDKRKANWKVCFSQSHNEPVATARDLVPLQSIFWYLQQAESISIPHAFLYQHATA